jgi:hypothetical protein
LKNFSSNFGQKFDKDNFREYKVACSSERLLLFFREERESALCPKTTIFFERKSPVGPGSLILETSSGSTTHYKGPHKKKVKHMGPWLL